MAAQFGEEHMLRSIKQHAILNNDIAENCFCSCVGGLVDRRLSEKEERCVEECGAKLIAATTRAMFKVAETNPMGMGGGMGGAAGGMQGGGGVAFK